MDRTIYWFGGPFGLRHDHKCAVYGQSQKGSAADRTRQPIFSASSTMIPSGPRT
jgi:hypothetical protein